MATEKVVKSNAYRLDLENTDFNIRYSIQVILKNLDLDCVSLLIQQYDINVWLPINIVVNYKSIFFSL